MPRQIKSKEPKQNKKAKTISSTQSLSSFVKSICDIMRRSKCASALQYVPELTWILFLRILDAQEERDRGAAEAVGGTFTPALVSPFRWLEDVSNLGKPFPSYARLLSSSGTPAGESRYSWTVDFADRRKVAREEMQPYLEEAAKLKGDVVTLKEKLKVLRKNSATTEEIEAVELKIKDTEKSSRDALAKADEIDASVFDLKAVNPNVVTRLDLRTADEIIGNIEKQGKIVADALNKLKGLLQ